jgi:hypothetical protein
MIDRRGKSGTEDIMEPDKEVIERTRECLAVAARLHFAGEEHIAGGNRNEC